MTPHKARLKAFQRRPALTMIRRGRLKDVVEVIATMESGAWFGAVSRTAPNHYTRLDRESNAGPLEHQAAPFAVYLQVAHGPRRDRGTRQAPEEFAGRRA